MVIRSLDHDKADAQTYSDLGRHRAPEDVYIALQDAWTVALSANSKVLALTVPECHARVDWLNENRAQVNHMIKRHQEPNQYVPTPELTAATLGY